MKRNSSKTTPEAAEAARINFIFLWSGYRDSVITGLQGALLTTLLVFLYHLKEHLGVVKLLTQSYAVQEQVPVLIGLEVYVLLRFMFFGIKDGIVFFYMGPLHRNVSIGYGMGTLACIGALLFSFFTGGFTSILAAMLCTGATAVLLLFPAATAMAFVVDEGEKIEKKE